MPVQNPGLFLLLLLAALICFMTGCLQTPAADDPAISAFSIPGKTALVNPAELRSNESIAIYGAPILFPDSGDYTIQTFGDLFTEGPQIYLLSFTVYGELYSVNLTRANRTWLMTASIRTPPRLTSPTIGPISA